MCKASWRFEIRSLPNVQGCPGSCTAHGGNISGVQRQPPLPSFTAIWLRGLTRGVRCDSRHAHGAERPRLLPEYRCRASAVTFRRRSHFVASCRSWPAMRWFPFGQPAPRRRRPRSSPVSLPDTVGAIRSILLPGKLAAVSFSLLRVTWPGEQRGRHCAELMQRRRTCPERLMWNTNARTGFAKKAVASRARIHLAFFAHARAQMPLVSPVRKTYSRLQWP